MITKQKSQTEGYLDIIAGRKPKRKEPVETADLRFKGSLPLQKYRKLTIGIAGLGAVGRQVAILLAAMGHKKLYGADHDKIELKNVGTQGWQHQWIGQYKADTLTNILNTRDSSFVGYPYKFEECTGTAGHRMNIGNTDVFFCCVDKMQARHAIWDVVTGEKIIPGCEDCTRRDSTKSWSHCKRKEKQNLQGLWIDARMTTRVIRIITVPLADNGAKEYYSKTLYTDVEAFDGSCTDRMTMYGANIAAGLMVSQLANWLNDVPLVTDFLLETQRMSSVLLPAGPVKEKSR